MSRTFSAPRWGSGAALAGILTLLMAAFAAFGLTSQANAAFTTGKCAGANITGEGASFARDAHKVFDFNFRNNYCAGTPGFGAITVTYLANGSGAGRAVMQDRAHPNGARFGMVDDPPTAADLAKINAGTTGDPALDTNPNDNGLVHVVPAAVGAAAILVNFPDDCDPDLLPDEARTDNPASADDDKLIRVRFSKEQLEGIFAKAPGYETWDQVFEELEEVEACEVPIIRVVRFDHSGTTFAVKSYLETINGNTGWIEDFGGANNREWPEANFGPRADCATNVGPGNDNTADGDPGPDQLTSGCSSSNSALVDKVIQTDGSIGYSDISTARAKGVTIDTAAPDDNDVYWTQIPNGSEQFTEPTADPNGYQLTGSKGSNCGAATFTNVPSSTLQDWSSVTGVDADAGYGICTLTYGLVFDDNADAWGGGPEEESKARTVKDYWQNILSDGAQGALFANDYAPLPSTPLGGNPDGILGIARAGIAAIDWEKGTGGGGNDDGGGNNDGGGSNNGGGGGASPAPLPLTPSNLFSLPRKTISSKTGGATVSVKIPGAGSVELVGTANVSSGNGKRSSKKTIQVGRTTLTASGPGTYDLALKPSNAAKQQLRSKGKLKVNLKVTYTPTGGTASTSTSSVTLKLAVKSSGKGR